MGLLVHLPGIMDPEFPRERLQNGDFIGGRSLSEALFTNISGGIYARLLKRIRNGKSLALLPQKTRSVAFKRTCKMSRTVASLRPHHSNLNLLSKFPMASMNVRTKGQESATIMVLPTLLLGDASSKPLR